LIYDWLLTALCFFCVFIKQQQRHRKMKANCVKLDICPIIGWFKTNFRSLKSNLKSDFNSDR
jgi:hypothetical protein